MNAYDYKKAVYRIARHEAGHWLAAYILGWDPKKIELKVPGNDSNLLIVFYVQIMPDDFVMQLHRF
ncbi:Uncharacterised protein [Klebsiella pneumoniae]|nr:Uncharacterised protein [Klebsiella pneumoniae]